MIIFKKIKWRNFLSYGNFFTEIQLNKTENTLIIGSNGAGKSTILDALCFSLFNKPFRKINKPQLVNTVNDKDSVVEIEFSKGNSEYKIVRGQKPNIFEIWKNGELLNQQANAADQQKHLEQNILKLNYKSFTQIVILGSSNFVPFMQLSTSNRRDVIEDLLDIKIFSSMNNIVKDNIRSFKEEVRSLTQEKNNLEEKIVMQENFIEELENRGNDNISSNREKIENLDKEIVKYIDINNNLDEKIKCHTKKQEELIGSVDKLAKLNNLKGKISQRVTTITKEHKFFTENSVCPTCTQTIEEEFRVNKITESQNKAKDLKKGYEDLEEAIEVEQKRECQFNILSQDIIKLTHNISQNNTRIGLYQRQIRDFESEIKKITDKLNNRNTEHDKLDSLKEQSKNNLVTLSERKTEIENYEIIHSLLKDGGVKTQVIKKYLPIINKQVNKYLQLMDFYINFSLDEEFKENVKSPVHEDFSYSSFSEGEKMRIDLALLFTWREISKIKNSSNTNLLIMDEVFDSSLDVSGTDEFMKIIRYIVKDTNIFVISHKSELHDKFENVVKFDKIKGFSQLVL